MQLTKTDMSTERKQTIDSLDDLLRTELAAAECYGVAIDKLKEDPVNELREVQRSHNARADLLRSRLISLGGDPSDGLGISGSFTKLLQRAAQLFGRGSTIKALEECEDRCLEEYRDRLAAMDGDTRTYVESTILTEQVKTHDLMSAVQRRCC